MRIPVLAEHVAVRVDAHPLLVGDADELERAVLEQRPLDAAAPGSRSQHEARRFPHHLASRKQGNEFLQRQPLEVVSAVVLGEVDHRLFPQKRLPRIGDEQRRMSRLGSEVVVDVVVPTVVPVDHLSVSVNRRHHVPARRESGIIGGPWRLRLEDVAKKMNVSRLGIAESASMSAPQIAVGIVGRLDLGKIKQPVFACHGWSDS